MFVVNCSFSTLLFIIEDIGMFHRHFLFENTGKTIF